MTTNTITKYWQDVEAYAALGEVESHAIATFLLVEKQRKEEAQKIAHNALQRREQDIAEIRRNA